MLAALRLVALAALGFSLCQPQEQREEVTILRPQVAVLVDNSQSMTDPADAAQPRRAERVKEFLSPRPPWRRRGGISISACSPSTAPSCPPIRRTDRIRRRTRPTSSPGSAQVQEHFRGQPLAAVLLLTDGLDTGGVAQAGAASLTRVPVDTFELEKAVHAEAARATGFHRRARIFRRAS